MRSRGYIIGLGGMSGTIGMTLVDQVQEFLRVGGFELFQSRNNDLAAGIFEDFESIAIVEQVLDPSAVDFKDGDGAG